MNPSPIDLSPGRHKRKKTRRFTCEEEQHITRHELNRYCLIISPVALITNTERVTCEEDQHISRHILPVYVHHCLNSSLHIVGTRLQQVVHLGSTEQQQGAGFKVRG